jgi:hypothetical protein
VEQERKILVEVTYKGGYCLLCFYMEEAVCQVIPQFSNNIIYQRIDFTEKKGKKRFLELSEKIYGGKELDRFIHTAPVPSLFIDGELIFDTIPTRHALETAFSEAIGGSPGIRGKAVP